MVCAFVRTYDYVYIAQPFNRPCTYAYEHAKLYRNINKYRLWFWIQIMPPICRTEFIFQIISFGKLAFYPYTYKYCVKKKLLTYRREESIYIQSLIHIIHILRRYCRMSIFLLETIFFFYLFHSYQRLYSFAFCAFVIALTAYSRLSDPSQREKKNGWFRRSAHCF